MACRLGLCFQERDADRQRVQELVEENTRLEWEKKSSLNESANLEEELSKARLQSSPGGMYHIYTFVFCGLVNNLTIQ